MPALGDSLGAGIHVLNGGGALDADAFKALIRAAVALNKSSAG